MATTTVPSIDTVRTFSGGKWTKPKASRAGEVFNPSTGKVIATVPYVSVEDPNQVVEFACGIPSLITGEILPNIATDVDAEAVRHPVGVCVGITPYNFPFMVPLWMFPIALTCGNTFVLKPSEKVPLSSVRLGELLAE